MVALDKLSQEFGRWLIWTGEPEEGKEGGWQYQDFRLQVGVGSERAGSAGRAVWRHVPDQEVWVERYHDYTGVKVMGENPRTYTGLHGTAPPGIMRMDGNGAKFPVYHGRVEDPSHPGVSLYGCQHGFFWLPPLAPGLRCEKVILRWEQNHSFDPIGTTPFGYHTLPVAPMTIDYADPRIEVNKFQYQFVRGQQRIIELPGFEEIVNRERLGGFGIVVGTENTAPEFYGYGQPVAVRYLWSQDAFNGWIK